MSGHPCFNVIYRAIEDSMVSDPDPRLQLRELMLLVAVHAATVRNLSKRYGPRDEVVNMAARDGLEAIAKACEEIPLT